MENVLEKISARSRLRLEERKKAIPISFLEKGIANKNPARGFAAALQQPGIRVIAELKAASPSKGIIRRVLEIEKLAPELEKSGAAALSVLTEPDFFSGSLENLLLAGKYSALPLLRKDFIYDEYQILEARYYGADAILLIAAMLDGAALKKLYRFALSLGLDVLCEAHTEKELDVLLENEVKIVGVNARNLSNFQTSLECAGELIRKIPPDKIIVAESAIQTKEDIKILQSVGAKAFLIGETLMRSECPGEKLCELLSK